MSSPAPPMSFERARILGGVEGAARARRARALDLAERALAAVEPGAATRRALGRLGPLEGATVFAIGKAALPMARAAAAELALAGGVVVASDDERRGEGARQGPSGIEVRFGGHPDPAADAETTGRAVLERARALGPADVALCLISGGGSSLLELPAPGISLVELRALVRALREGGAAIDELNSVRRALSQLKGGGLAAAMAPAAVRNVVLSDVAPHPPSVVASGPTCPPEPGAPDPRVVLARYGLSLPEPLRGRLAGPPAHQDVRTELAADVFTACAAVVAADRALGERAGTFGGGARALGARIAAEAGPRGWVWGGETTVALQGEGVGGRNQEVALGALQAGWRGGLLLTLGTDGVDGASDAAGALIDAAAVRAMRERGLDPAAALAANDATPFFDALGTTLRCGPTGTNVADLCLYLPD